MVVAEAIFYGGSRKLTLSFEYQLSPHIERAAWLDPTASNFACRLPDAREYATAGGTMQMIANSNGAAQALTVKNKDGTTLTTVAAGQVRWFCLLDNTTSAGLWVWLGPRTYSVGGLL